MEISNEEELGLMWNCLSAVEKDTYLNTENIPHRAMDCYTPWLNLPGELKAKIFKAFFTQP